MRLLGFIALGGAVGSVARFLIGAFIQQRVTTPMPVGTLAVNIIGSLLVGFLLTYALASSSISPDVRALLTTGFCGGFTTFSTFSYETVALVQVGDLRRAFAYIALTVVCSLGAAFAGVYLGQRVIATRHATVDRREDARFQG